MSRKGVMGGSTIVKGDSVVTRTGERCEAVLEPRGGAPKQVVQPQRLQQRHERVVHDRCIGR